jgi:hypothetical protein
MLLIDSPPVAGYLDESHQERRLHKWNGKLYLSEHEGGSIPRNIEQP